MIRGAARLALTARLLLLGALPLLGTLYFVSMRMVDDMNRYAAIKSASEHVALLIAIDDLVHGLQIERGLTLGFLTSGGGRAAELAQVRRATDAAIDALRGGRASVPGREEATAALAAHADLRAAADRLEMTPAKAFAAYCTIIDKLMANAVRQVGLIDDTQLQSDGNALSAFSRAKEAAGRERAILHAALIAGRLDRQTRSQILTLARTQEVFLLQFAAMAKGETLAAYASRTGDAFREAERLRDSVLDAAGGRTNVEPERWFAAATAKIDRMKEIEESMARDTQRGAVASVDKARSEALWNLSLCVLIALATLVLVVALAGVVRRRPETVDDDPPTAG